MRRNRTLIDIIEDHERDIKRLRQALARVTVGAIDHGTLTGLADDDHPQYWNDARGATGAAAKIAGDDLYLKTAGDTMTGRFEGLDAAFSQQVDFNDDSDFKNNRIKNVGAPIVGTDGMSRAHADTIYLRTDDVDTAVDLGNGLRYTVAGQFILLRISTTVSAGSTLGTMPSGLRPALDIVFMGAVFNSGGSHETGNFGTFRVRASGAVALYGANGYGASDTIRGSMMYMVGGG